MTPIDIQPRDQESLRNKVTHLCRWCGDAFDEFVWHCQACDHHWTAGETKCRNCHRLRSEQDESKPPISIDTICAVVKLLAARLEIGKVSREDVPDLLGKAVDALSPHQMAMAIVDQRDPMRVGQAIAALCASNLAVLEVLPSDRSRWQYRQ
jgi:hypothetical protein